MRRMHRRAIGTDEAPMTLAVVWFKRDLRVFDHLPLIEASRHPTVLPLYVYEPEILHAPDYATQHLAFTNECLEDLDLALTGRGSPLLIQHGEITSVLKRVLDHFGRFTLYSHEETGNAISYARDLRVADWCRSNGVRWKESPANGVVRRLSSRDQWAAQWMQRMRTPVLASPDFLRAPGKTLSPAGPMTAHQLGLDAPDKPLRQRGGRRLASLQVKQFFDHHLADYRYSMSSPLSAEESCSRLSPYLAYGVLSVREIMHKIWKTRAQLQALPEPARPAATLASLKSFESRLHWHCHFIQKLESEPRIELHNMHRGFDGLREDQFHREHFERWCAGETGFPLIDACMKMLAQTGWINFRMRALLVSFSSYQLWNHWREPALHLAREFLDYEPGIHYSQIQMQSGVTGINTLRIYNPVKQAQDQDPAGVFVKRWLPQLQPVPNAFIFEPALMPLALQQEINVIIGQAYPAPVVDHLATARHARETLWSIRRTPKVRTEAQQVFNRHGSRNPLREGRPRRAVRRDDEETGDTTLQIPLGLE
jgi:deoxyribodipyrimidine photo-lyase